MEQHQEVSETQSLLSLILILSRIPSQQIRGLVSFVQNNQLTQHNNHFDVRKLETFIKILREQDLNQLIKKASSTYNLEKPPPTQQNNNNNKQSEDEDNFVVLYHLLSLQELLRKISINQLMKIFEIALSEPTKLQQLQVFEQLQQLLAQLQSTTLSNLQNEIKDVTPGTETQKLIQLVQLDGEHFHLYRALTLLLQLELPELLKLQENFPKLQLLQLVQITRLVEVGLFDVLDLRALLLPETQQHQQQQHHHHQQPNQNSNFNNLNNNTSGNRNNFFANVNTNQQPQPQTISQSQQIPDLQLNNSQQQPYLDPFDMIPDDSSMDPDEMDNEDDNGLKLEIVEQPPEKCVYKRNIKPAPTIMVVGEHNEDEGIIYVVATLNRCDTGEATPKLITGNKPVRVTTSRVIPFKRLKILVTSHQLNETLFSLKFELRRYKHENDENYELIASIVTNPICVLSHSTQLKPTTTVSPVVLDVLPISGPTTGFTRVAVLGSNFVESPTTRVKFDNIEVMPIFHGPKTLIVHTPKHLAGTVEVRVCNDAKRWSETAGVFRYEDPVVNNDNNDQQPNTNSPSQSRSGSGNLEVAFEGGFETVRILEEKQRT